MSKKRIAVIAGDGIGKEVMPEGLRVLEAAASKLDIRLQLDHFDFSSWDYYEKHGEMLPADWKERIGGHDAILFGAVALALALSFGLGNRELAGEVTRAWYERYKAERDAIALLVDGREHAAVLGQHQVNDAAGVKLVDG